MIVRERADQLDAERYRPVGLEHEAVASAS